LKFVYEFKDQVSTSTKRFYGNIVKPGQRATFSHKEGDTFLQLSIDMYITSYLGM
jgi:hypothetical protein